MKSVYICGPLTELAPDQQASVKAFYSKLGDLCAELTSVRAFVPHEHYDPIANANFAPAEVDVAERKQVCEMTSVMLVVAIEPTWGGGIEVEMAYRSGVPVILLCPKEKLEQRRISRLLRGNPAVKEIVGYKNEEDAIELLRGLKMKYFTALV